MTPSEAKDILGQARRGVLNEVNTTSPQRAPANRAYYIEHANSCARAMVYHALATHAATNGGVIDPADAAKILATGASIVLKPEESSTNPVVTGDNAADTAANLARGNGAGAVNAGDTFDNQVLTLGQIAAAHIGTRGKITRPAAQALISALITAAQNAVAQQGT